MTCSCMLLQSKQQQKYPTICKLSVEKKNCRIFPFFFFNLSDYPVYYVKNLIIKSMNKKNEHDIMSHPLFNEISFLIKKQDMRKWWR